MSVCSFNPSNQWSLINYYCLYYNIGDNWASGTWYINNDKKHAIKIFGSNENGGFGDNSITVSPPSQESFISSYFDSNNLVLNGTRLQDDAYGFNDIGLDFNNNIITFLFDESGSMLWNDNGGFRYDLAKRYINRVAGAYPAEVLYKIFKFGGQKVKLTIGADLESSNQLSQLRTEFFQQYLFGDSIINFTGIRVVRREDGFPSNPIDGDIIFDGISNGVQDLNVSADSTYYYTVYTFNSNYQFSDGVRIQVTSRDGDSPRGVKTFDYEVLSGSGVPFDENIVGVWHFDEADGQVVYDFATNVDLSVSETNAIWLTEEDVPVGQSGLRFNGETTSVSTQSVVSNFELRQSSYMTLSAWIKPYNFSSNRAIISRQDGTNLNYFLYTNTSGGLTFETAFTNASSTNGILTEEQWNKVDVVIDMFTGIVSFYVNGSPAGSPVLSNLNLTFGNMYFDVGYNRGAISGIERFFGEICEISVHDVARGFNYITEHHNILRNDNGDRLVILKYAIPEVYNFNGNDVVIIANEMRVPSYVGDGLEIHSNTITSSGDFYTTFRDEFLLGSNYYFRIFSKNQNRHYCHIDDAMSLSVLVPNIDTENREIVPSLSSLLAPPYNIEAIAGDRKVYIRWDLDPSDERLKRVRLYRSDSAFPILDEEGNSDSILIFDGDTYETGYVDVLLSNNVRYYYTLCSIDKYGRPSEESTVDVVPSSGLDESRIPLRDVKNVRYEIVDGNHLNLMWDEFVLERDISTFFSENIVFYMKLTDQSGNKLTKDYTISCDIIDASYTYPDDVAEDIFINDTNIPTPDINDLYSLTVTSVDKGLSKGLVELTKDNSLLTNIKSVLLVLRFNVTFSSVGDSEFVYRSRPIVVEWKNNLSVDITNKDSKYVEITSKHKINALDDQVPSSVVKYNGIYATSSNNYVCRVYLYNAGQQASIVSSTVDVAVYDATIDFDDIVPTPVRGNISSTVRVLNSLSIVSGTREVRNVYGEFTGETENVTYVDILLFTPSQEHTVLLYVKSRLIDGSTIIKKILVVFKSPLIVDILPSVPVGDGRQVREQSALVYMVDPDDPDDLSKRTYLPDTTMVEWKLEKKSDAIDRIFYSMDSTPSTDGIFSYLNRGLARNVFLGPINNVKVHGYDSAGNPQYETHTMSVSVFYDGVSATDSQDIELIPLREKGHRVMPSNFLMEFSDLKQKFWTDGIGYATLIISHNAESSTTKYSQPFRQCMSLAGKQIYQLNSGMMVRIDTNDPDVEIIWGDVVEYLDPYLDRWVLDTSNAHIAYGAASVNLSQYNDTYVYFRQDKKYTSQGAAGFERLRTDCSSLSADKYTLYNDEITVTGHIVSDFNGDLLTLTGGGSFGTGLVPTVLIPEEPLRVRAVDRRSRIGNAITRQEGIILDGVSINQFVLDVSFAETCVPDGTPIDIEVVNYSENSVEPVNSRIRTATTVDSDIDPDRERSYAVFELQPLQPKKNIAANIYLTATYHIEQENIGVIDRTETICLLVRYDADDWKDQSSASNIRSIFSGRVDRYNTSTNAWTQLASMNTARGHLCVESVGNIVYAIGGIGANEILSTVEEYDISSDSWAEMTSMNTARMGAMSVVVGTDIYVLGGIEYDRTNNRVYVSRAVERYDTLGNSWAELDSMPTIDVGSIERIPYGVAFGCAEYIQSLNRIYVVSGIRDITDDAAFIDHNNRVLYYDIDNDEWGYSDPISETEFRSYYRISPISFVDGNEIIVLSGAYQKLNGSLEYYVTSYAYNTSSGSVESREDEFNHMLQPKYFAASATSGTETYSVGGFGPDSETLKTFEIVENVGGNPLYDVAELGNTTKSKNGGGCCFVSSGGITNLIYAGGVESGKGNGFLKMTISPYEDEMMLNGRQYLGARVSMTDDSGENDVLATARITGYLQITDPIDETLVPQDLLPYNILFDEEVLDIVDGKAEVSLKPRSDDILKKLNTSLNFTEGSDNNLYKIVLQSTIIDGYVPETIGTAGQGPVPYYGQTLLNTISDDSNATVLSPTCIVPVSSNIIIASLNSASIFEDNVFKLISAPLYQNRSVATDVSASSMVIPLVADLTSGGPVQSSSAISVIDEMADAIPVGCSPLYDALEVVSNTLNNEEFDNYGKSIISFVDSDPNTSDNSNQDAIDAVNNIDNYQDVPLLVGNLSMSSPYVVSSSLEMTGSVELDKLAYFTGGQSFSIVSTQFEDELVCMMTGRARGSLGYGSAVYTIDLGEFVNLESANVIFSLPDNTYGEWRMSVSEDGYDYTPYTIYFTPGFDVGFSSLDTRYIRFDMRLQSCLTITNEESDESSPTGMPLIEGLNFGYTPVKTDYLFVNELTVNDNTQQAIATLDADDENGEIQFGISTSKSHNWNDFDSDSKPSRPIAGGNVILPVRNRDIVGIRSEELINVDNCVFRARYGNWDYESTVAIYDSSNDLIDSSLYKTYPRQGRVIFSAKMYDSYIIRIQDPDKIRSGFRINNSNSNVPVNIYGLGEMYASQRSIKDYLQGTTSATTATTVCVEFPWITCSNPSHSVASVAIDSVPGNGCYDRSSGTYVYDSTLDTIGFTGWWFRKVATNIALIILFCKSDEKYYAEIYDISADEAIFGADTNECPCVSLENDKLRDLSGTGLCCDNVSEAVIGEFVLRGIGDCSFYNATVTVSV